VLLPEVGNLSVPEECNVWKDEMRDEIIEGNDGFGNPVGQRTTYLASS